MAEVTGFTADRMLAIEAETIVDGRIDEEGHLILTRHDGIEIDAGYALVAVPTATASTAGVVELATEAETFDRIDNTRAVTPASLASTVTTINDAISSLTPSLIQYLSTSTFNNATPSTSYPRGVSVLYLSVADSTAGAWGPFVGQRVSVLTISPLGDGNVTQLTVRHNDNAAGVNRIWIRGGRPTGWADWSQLANQADPSTMGITGEIKMWPVSTIPNGWSLCDGGTLSRTTNAALFAVIGTTYGAGDTTTTFNKPDFRGRVPAGFDSTQTEFNTTGKTGGEKTHVLTTDEMPSHTHVQNPHNHAFSSNGNAVTDGTVGTIYPAQTGSTYNFRPASISSATPTNQTAGGGGAHNNLAPYVTIRFIIKL